jgi:transposase
MVTDGRGLPLAIEATAGQAHESTQFETLMEAVRIPGPLGRPRSRPERVAGDKAYSVEWIRKWLRRHAIGAVIPQRSDQADRHRGRPLAFDRQAYRRRSIIECCVGWLKQCRRIATRFEKLAVNFLAMAKVAIVQRILRILLSDRA